MDEVSTLNIKTEQSKYLNGAQPKKMMNEILWKNHHWVDGWDYEWPFHVR